MTVEIEPEVTPEEPVVEAPPEPEPTPDEDIETRELTGAIEVRDVAKRELGLFIVPWDTVVETNLGAEMFVNGAFDGVNPSDVRLRMNHQNPATGKGISLDQRADGAHMAFRVAKTARGDEQLTLAAEQIEAGASVGFTEVPGGTTIEMRNGRRIRVHRKVDLREVSTTWQPAYERAAVTYIRSKEETPVADSPAPVAPDESQAVTAVQSAFDSVGSKLEGFADKFAERLDKLEERSRSNFTVPAPEPEPAKISAGEWMDVVLHMLSGDRIPEMQTRALADVITADNIGVVPDNFSSELIGVIDPRRPFMDSTRRLATPSSGMKLVVPVITQRPTVALQSEEKAELSSQTTKIDTVDFDVVTKGGAGDISLQILKRADRSFLDLYLQLLAEAYAIEAETEAVESLLGADVDDGNTLDPENLLLGSAFTTAFDVIRRPPDTMWCSSEAIAAFIDAKANASNAPLYPGLTASATAGGGITGTISGLRVVHVPVLNGAGADVIVGPSSGFAWAEDGTFTLQVDVPSKAGRDVALVGMLWFAPWYPTAFTVYNLAS